VKTVGPVFTKKDNLWESPVYETTVAEYIDYIKSLDLTDPNCEEKHASQCPRLYLNGWPAFSSLPWLQEYIENPTFFDDFSGELIAESESLKETFVSGLTGGFAQPKKEERQKGVDNEYWEMTKLFMSPKGAVTRLHFDNGGAHAWLSQVRGRKMFICFEPTDTPNLHPFEGDEGLMNGSFLDPLDPEVDKKWPDYAKAIPYVGVVEQGETIVAPQGWWHYAVALDDSITVMRNFYSRSNQKEHINRKDAHLERAFFEHVLKKQAKFQKVPDDKLRDVARASVAKIRKEMIEAARQMQCEIPGQPRK